MLSVLVDTSALYAALEAADPSHAEVLSGWTNLLDGIADGSTHAVTHGGIVIETTALVQRHLGMAAVRDLHLKLLPIMSVEWIDHSLHQRAVAALVAADRREVSMVDWTSFEVMRANSIHTAFAFDEDFARQGFASWIPA